MKQVQAMIAERQQELQRALAEVSGARAEAERAQAGVRAMQAAAERAAAAVDTAAAEVEASTTRVAMAQAEARAATEEVTSSAAGARGAGAKARAMRAMTEQTAAALAVAQTVRGYTEIRATGPARVLQRVVSPGTLVDPGALLLRLAQIDRVRLQANVSQVDLREIEIGARVWVQRVDDPDEPLEATVTSVAPAADPAARTSVVEAIVDNPGHEFLPGQAISMRIETASVDSAITVPAAAVISRSTASAQTDGEAGHAVWTVAVRDPETGTVYTCTIDPEVRETDPGACPRCSLPLVTAGGGRSRIAQLVDVEIGPSDGRRTQIVSGIMDGQEVITRGVQGLREGQAIQEVPWDDTGPLQLPGPVAAPPSGPATPDHGGHRG